MIRSASVEFARSDRARTRCFVDTCQLGAFARSTIMSVVFPAPSPTPPPKRGRGGPQVPPGLALPLFWGPPPILSPPRRAPAPPFLSASPPPPPARRLLPP